MAARTAARLPSAGASRSLVAGHGVGHRHRRASTPSPTGDDDGADGGARTEAAADAPDDATTTSVEDDETDEGDEERREADESAAPASGFEHRGPAHLPGQRRPAPTTARDPVPTAPAGAVELPRGVGRDVRASPSVGSETRTVVRVGVDRPAVGVRARRPHVGRVRRLRPGTSTSSTGETGADILPPFPTGDIIKGSVTDRPRRLPARVLRLTGQRASTSSPSTGPSRPSCGRCPPTPCRRRCGTTTGTARALVLDDYLIEGGENSQFHVVKLNRSYGADGLVQVDPELVFNTPGWDQELLDDIGDTQVSIENSVAVHDGVAYFTQLAAGSCRAGTSAASTRGRADAGVPVLDRRRHRRVASSSTRRASSTSPPSTSGATPAARRSGSC